MKAWSGKNWLCPQQAYLQGLRYQRSACSCTESPSPCARIKVPGCTKLSKRFYILGHIHLQDEAVREVHTDGHRTHGLCLGKGLLVPQLLGLQRGPLFCVLPRPAWRAQVDLLR